MKYYRYILYVSTNLYTISDIKINKYRIKSTHIRKINNHYKNHITSNNDFRICKSTNNPPVIQQTNQLTTYSVAVKVPLIQSKTKHAFYQHMIQKNLLSTPMAL